MRTKALGVLVQEGLLALAEASAVNDVDIAPARSRASSVARGGAAALFAKCQLGGRSLRTGIDDVYFLFFRDP